MRRRTVRPEDMYSAERSRGFPGDWKSPWLEKGIRPPTFAKATAGKPDQVRDDKVK